MKAITIFAILFAVLSISEAVGKITKSKPVSKSKSNKASIEEKITKDEDDNENNEDQKAANLLFNLARPLSRNASGMFVDPRRLQKVLLSPVRNITQQGVGTAFQTAGRFAVIGKDLSNLLYGGLQDVHQFLSYATKPIENLPFSGTIKKKVDKDIREYLASRKALKEGIFGTASVLYDQVGQQFIDKANKRMLKSSSYLM